MSNLVFILELIGTVAFSLSGTLTGIQKKMDLLGVMILGAVTATGGGILRDILLGIIPRILKLLNYLASFRKINLCLMKDIPFIPCSF